MTDIYYEAIELDYPGTIRRSIRKSHAKTPWYWANADTPPAKFFFATREECARDLATDMDYKFAEAIITLLKNGVAIDIPQSELDNVQLDIDL